MKTKSMIVGLMLTAAIAVSCDRNDDQPNSAMVVEENELAVDANEIDAIVDEAYEAASTELKSASADGGYLSTCAIITLDKSSTVKVLTIDFGTGCQGKDGKTRTGKIIITTESFTDTNKLRTITFDGYTVNGKQVEGTIEKTITLIVDANVKVAQISEDLTFVLPDNKGTATRVANITRRYEFNTLGAVVDNKLYTWGETIFTRANGRVLTKTIDETTPLLYKTVCKQTVSGIMTLDFDGDKTWTIDFGNGVCDRLATATDGEKTWVVVL